MRHNIKLPLLVIQMLKTYLVKDQDSCWHHQCKKLIPGQTASFYLVLYKTEEYLLWTEIYRWSFVARTRIILYCTVFPASFDDWNKCSLLWGWDDRSCWKFEKSLKVHENALPINKMSPLQLSVGGLPISGFWVIAQKVNTRVQGLTVNVTIFSFWNYWTIKIYMQYTSQDYGNFYETNLSG